MIAASDLYFAFSASSCNLIVLIGFLFVIEKIHLLIAYSVMTIQYNRVSRKKRRQRMIKLKRTTIVQQEDGEILIKINTRPGDPGVVVNPVIFDNWCVRQVRERLFEKPEETK